VPGIVGKVDRVNSIFLRKSLHPPGAVELYRVELALARIVFVASEVDRPRNFIDGLDSRVRTFDGAENFEVSLCELPFQLGV
jgi:hypothetical protein